MVFSLPDEEYHDLDRLSKKYDTSMSGILRIGLLCCVRHHKDNHSLPDKGRIELRKRMSS